MMSDITYCTNQGCPDRRRCERGVEVEGIHSFSEFEGKLCDWFIPRMTKDARERSDEELVILAATIIRRRDLGRYKEENKRRKNPETA